jgi:hypothetical protein
MVYMVRGGLEAPLSCVAEGDGYLAYQAGDGLESPTCALTFLLVYTAGLSASVWWFLLSLSWYLTAAHRWSSEALYSLATYFHLAAWALPALIALLALVLHRFVLYLLFGDQEVLGLDQFSKISVESLLFQHSKVLSENLETLNLGHETRCLLDSKGFCWTQL